MAVGGLMGWAATDEEEFPADVPVAAHAITLPEQRIEGDSPNRDLEETSAVADLLASLPALTGVVNPEPLARTGRRVARSAQQAYEHPGDALRGLGETTGLSSLADRFLSHPSGVSRTTGQPYEAVDLAPLRQETAAAQEAAQTRSPAGYAGGQAGGVASLLGLGLLAGPGEAATTGLERVLGAGLESGVAGGADAAARSGAADAPGFAGDVATGTAIGAVPGVGLGLLAEGAGAARRALASRGAMATDHTLAAIGGERQLSPSRLQEWGQTPEAREESLRLLREGGLELGPLDTSQSIRDRARETAAESYGRSQDIRQRFDEAGGIIPLDEVVQPMRAYGDTIALDPGMRRAGVPGMVEETASEWARQPEIMREAAARGVRGARELPVVAPAAHAPLEHQYGLSIGDLEQFIRTHGDSLRWPTSGRPSLPESVGEDLYGIMRDAGDEAVGRTLGGEEAERFARERLRTQVLQRARQHAQRSLDRGAGARSGGLTELMSGQVGATAGGAVGGAPGALVGAGLARGASRLARPSELARRAWVSNLAQRLSSGAALPPSIARWEHVLRQAAGRGALPAVHELLARRDPEYAEATTHEMSSALQPLSGEAPTDALPDGFLPDEEEALPEGFLPDEESP